MGYEDFVIQLGIDARGPTVRVTRSPAGESEAEPLSLSLNDKEILDLAVAFAQAADIARQGRHLSLDRVAAEPSVAETGARLFRALFPETVHSRFQQSLGRVAERGQGLRIRIEVGLGSSELARLQAVPWEYLADDGHFLGLSREISIVRHLSLGQPSDRPPVPPPLRILVLAGETFKGSNLDLAEEKRMLEQAWSDSGSPPARIYLLPDCTLDALREELLAQEYHALHFMGHGAFSDVTGDGALAFRTQEGDRVWVSGAELAEQIRDRTSLRLVFLNACETAQLSAKAPYAGVATALLRAGIPAVVAMQFPISDAAALVLSRTFYRRIARGDTVDAAIAEGRMAIRRLAPSTIEWGTPVLFERLTSGGIVEPTRLPPQSQRRSRTRVWAALAAIILGAVFVLIWFWLVARKEHTDALRPQSTDINPTSVREGSTTSSSQEPPGPQVEPSNSTRPIQVASETDTQKALPSGGNGISGTASIPEEKKGDRVEPVPERKCSTWKSTYDSPSWWRESPTGGFGFEDSAFKILVSGPGSGDKRCENCRVAASTFQVSATVWSTGNEATWGLYILDMSEVQGEWFSFELGPKGRAAIKHYRDGRDTAILWAGIYPPQEKDRLTLEAGDGMIVASINGAKLAQAAYDSTSVPKVPLGVGFVVTRGSESPVAVWFDNYEFTACFPAIAR